MNAASDDTWYAAATQCAASNLVNHINDVLKLHDLEPATWITYHVDHARLGTTMPADLGASTSGSAFGADGELRWRVDRGKARAVVIRIDANRTRPDGNEWLNLTHRGTTTWILSGVYRHGSWADARFPRPFDYELGEMNPTEGQRLAVHMTTLSERSGGGATAFTVHRKLELMDGA